MHPFLCAAFLSEKINILIIEMIGKLKRMVDYNVKELTLCMMLRLIKNEN